ncbi:tRNA adenosine(34) deaminase TadA [Maricaulis sp.]|uniref:tRNA adenosine(34) deaminase TadA n=1 Tax=Maricaulis sp. TaxID=1486257 RepID=UPI00344FF902
MRRSSARSMTNPRDTRFMTAALRLAQAAAEAGEAPIGALVVDPATDRIIAQAHNRPIAGHDPTAHAEILALRDAALLLGNYRLTGLELYVTLEPCAMCAGAISHARIGRLVFGASDPKGGAVVSGPRFFEQPTCHWRPEVVSGILAEDGATLLKDFFRARRKAKPAEAGDGA